MINVSTPQRIVLVVENSELLGLFIVNLVEEAGYVAIQANNAKDALLILASRTDIALLVTNFVMDVGMNGVDLAHKVSIRWPCVKIIVVSGHPGLSEPHLPAKFLLITKPYHDNELVFEVRSQISALAA